MSLLGFDISALIQEATQIHNTSARADTAESLCKEYVTGFTKTDQIVTRTEIQIKA